MDRQMIKSTNKTPYRAFKSVIFSVVFLFCLFIGGFCQATVLVDFSDGDNNIGINSKSTDRIGQTFYFTGGDYSITSISMKLWRDTSGGKDSIAPIRVSFYNTSAGLPSGSVLFYCDTDFPEKYNYITTATTGAWYDAVCDTPFFPLTKDVVYALAISTPDEVSGNPTFIHVNLFNSIQDTWFVENNGSNWYHSYGETQMILKINGDITPTEINFVEIDKPEMDVVATSGNILYNIIMRNDSGYTDLKLTFDNITTSETTIKNLTIPVGQYPQRIGYQFLYNGEYEMVACMIKSGSADLCSEITTFEIAVGSGGAGQYETPPPEITPFVFDYQAVSPFDDPTEFYTFITGAWNNLLSPVNTWANYFALQFNFSDLSDQTDTIKDNIKLFRSYIGTLDEFFGGVPISLFLTVFILIIIGKTIFMLSYRIISLIKP
jgi:hypothetical protein